MNPPFEPHPPRLGYLYAPLDELDANQFYDVYRVFRPDATREEFDQEWAKFQALKAEYLKRKGLQ